MNTKLQAIAAQAAEDLKAFVKEAEQKIQESWNEAVSQAELDDTHPKLKLGFSITLNLDSNHMETALGFGVKYKLTRDSEIPDPNQEKLPLEEEEPTVRIHTIDPDTGEDHDTGNIPISKFKKAAAKLKGN